MICYDYFRRNKGRPEYYQQLLWRPGAKSPHCSTESYGKTLPAPTMNKHLTSTLLVHFGKRCNEILVTNECPQPTVLVIMLLM